MRWSELAAHVESKYEVLALRDDALSVRWNGVETRGVGPQKLVLIHARLVDLHSVMVAAFVGSEHAWSLRDALLHGSGLVAGGIALRDGAYVLRVSALLDTLRTFELDSIVDYAARKATELRQLLVRADADPRPFEWIQD
jgi:hypothetical protein